MPQMKSGTSDFIVALDINSIAMFSPTATQSMTTVTSRLSYGCRTADPLTYYFGQLNDNEKQYLREKDELGENILVCSPGTTL